MGMVTQKYDLPEEIPEEILNPSDELPEAILDLDAKEVPHIGFGAGLHIAMNQNFIITVDYGISAKKEDGDSGLYINLSFLF